MKQSYLKVAQHPCFNRAAHRWFSCIHIPVAPRCNIKCGYCSRAYDCPNYNPPGRASKVLTASRALSKVKKAVCSDPRITVAGISGPGEPLANKETFETLGLLKREFPNLIKCVSTNGLLLADKVDELAAAGVNSLHVTVNAVDSEVARYIYGWVRYKGEEFMGEQGAALLLNRQLDGIRAAVKRGIVVKVNSVLIPGINENHISDIAVTVKKLGAHSMSILPLTPQADFASFQPPSQLQITSAKRSSAGIIEQTENYRSHLATVY